MEAAVYTETLVLIKDSYSIIVFWARGGAIGSGTALQAATLISLIETCN
jgi:hypothetical protein